MQSSILIISILFLVGCASTKEPAINTVIQKVEVPIAVPCKANIPVKPDFNFDKLTPEQDVFEKTKALLADRKLHLGYEGELLTSLVACTK
jgi:PBP1b-binding outer membrane lipoprotein LpoB